MEDTINYRKVVTPKGGSILLVEMDKAVQKFTMSGKAKVTMPCGASADEVICRASDLLATDDPQTLDILARLGYITVSELLLDLRSQDVILDLHGARGTYLNMNKVWILNTLKNEQ